MDFLENNELYGLKIVVKYNDLSKRVYKKIVILMDIYVNDLKKIVDYWE